MRSTEKTFRNHFAILLLRGLFTTEAQLAFGDTTDNLKRYLSIPRGNQQSISDIRNYRFSEQGQESAEKAADSTITWVVKRKSLFRYTDEMLDIVAGRLTFFGKFNSFSEFERQHSDQSNIYDVYIGKEFSEIPGQVQIEIKHKVEQYVRNSFIFIRQNGIIVNGTPSKKIYQLEEGFAVGLMHDFKEIIGEERLFSLRPEFNMFLFTGPKDHPDLYRAAVRYAIINANLCMVGELAINVCNFIEKGIYSFKGEIMTIIKPVPAAQSEVVIINYIAGATARYCYTLLFHLIHILKQIDSTLYNKWDIIVLADDLRKPLLSIFFKFKILDTHLPVTEHYIMPKKGTGFCITYFQKGSVFKISGAEFEKITLNESLGIQIYNHDRKGNS